MTPIPKVPLISSASPSDAFASTLELRAFIPIYSRSAQRAGSRHENCRSCASYKISPHKIAIGLLFFLLLFCISGGGEIAAQEAEQQEEAAAIPEETPGAEAAESESDLQARVNEVFGKIVEKGLYPVLFFKFDDLWAEEDLDEGGGLPVIGEIPLIIMVLVFGGVFFTLWYGFVNIRLFRHSIDVIRGKYDNPGDRGEISHFKALTSALSATVGLGNIAGVALAISLGGPGAVFWMWLTAFFGMSLKFSSCTLAQVYRRIRPDGRVLGGPMIYMEDGVRECVPRLAPLAKVFAIVFCILTIFAAFGGGNLFQANQTYSVIASQLYGTERETPLWLPWLLGFVMAFGVGLVIIGGIKRIGAVTCRMVPAMCLFYCAVCLIIVVMNIGQVPKMFQSIFAEAFRLESAFGGLVGVLIVGMKRAAFSNEAGLGSAAFAHAAARTEEPVREGVVAMIGPFIDTLVVCTMTALAILITKSHLREGLEGVQLTLLAFQQLGTIAPVLLCFAVFVFAYSTVISWGYYGERATEYLFGESGIVPYRILYTLVVILGPVLSLGAVVDFADMMLLSMAFPNIIVLLILSRKLKSLVNDYVRRLKSGEMKPYSGT